MLTSYQRALKALNLIKIVDADTINGTSFVVAEIKDNNLRMALDIIISSFKEAQTVFRNSSVYLKTYSSSDSGLVDLAPLTTVLGIQLQATGWRDTVDD